nr:alpha/beta fold hydrolase [uncultured Rhodopila sp.]
MIRRCCLLILIAAASCGSPSARTHPGDIVQAEAVPGAPPNASATRIVYVSTAPDGAQIQVSALVVVPGSAPAAGERPVLAWLHPTTGVDHACAPTAGPGPFAQIQGLAAFLAAGYTVVATDYPGLGASGMHPYLVGASEARAAIDSVRAVRHLPGADAGARFAVWGHSQGGHAALFTAALAPSYAPELQLVGAAAAAPVTDAAALIEQPGRDPLWAALLSYTVWSWSHLYGLDPNAIIPPGAEATIARTARDCLESAAELRQLLADSAPLTGQTVTPDQSWRAMLASNDPPAGGSQVPVFLAQGDQDPVIIPSLTRAFARRLCGAGVPVRYLAMPGVDHYTAAVRSASAAAAWIADRFAGAAPPDDCAAAFAE